MAGIQRDQIADFSEIRKAAGLSVAEISELTGVSKGWIYQFEKDKRSYYGRTYLAVFYTLIAVKLGMENELFMEVQKRGQEETRDYLKFKENDAIRATTSFFKSIEVNDFSGAETG